MFYDEFRGILEDIATENGAIVHPNVGKGKGRRSIKVEAVSCPAVGHECAPSPEAMIDRLQELVGVEFVEMKEKVKWNQYAGHVLKELPRIHPDKCEWSKVKDWSHPKADLIMRTPLINRVDFEEQEYYLTDLEKQTAHFTRVYRRLYHHTPEGVAREQTWVWKRATKQAVLDYIHNHLQPRTQWLVQIVLSKELSRLEPRRHNERKEQSTERAPDAKR